MSKNKLGRWIGFTFVLMVIASLLLYTAKDSIIKGEPNVVDGYTKWSPELVEEFGTLPIQDGGRVKPMSTWAGFELLALNGKRKVRFESDGEKVSIGPTEWALDMLFRDEFTQKMEIFQVEDDAVLDMIEMPHENKKRRDRYSMEELQQYLHKVDALRAEVGKKPADDRDPIEKQFMGLVSNIQSYVSLSSHLTPVKEAMAEEGQLNNELRKFSSWVEQWPKLSQYLAMLSQQSGAESEGIRKVAGIIAKRVGDSVYSQVAMYPPIDPKQKSWTKRGDWLSKYMQREVPADADQIEYLKEMEALALAYNEGGESALLTAVKEFKTKAEKRMEARGEGKTMKGELAYEKMDYFYRSLTHLYWAFWSWHLDGWHQLRNGVESVTALPGFC
ncbi:hypothetical protein [Rubritalea tangerina]|uniref:hypothetical protein n=1 Tax=Rubritalea tangerina TaxID=430798 RepID=UPI0036180B4D